MSQFSLVGNPKIILLDEPTTRLRSSAGILSWVDGASAQPVCSIMEAIRALLSGPPCG
ncbi:hypothetical protein [Paenibacillus nasutitermitis]|uniref:hypothetical protein n=1 Tax=Paenibacillus nasutitermitis TaxID=1652958 RepID=UPI001667BC02|nr:hypothetical protein [Paenibacillus nasutitermitis]